MGSQTCQTALLVAVQHGRDAMVDKLLDRGADMEARTAVSQGRHFECVKGGSNTAWCRPAALSHCMLRCARGREWGQGEGGAGEGRA